MEPISIIVVGGTLIGTIVLFSWIGYRAGKSNEQERGTRDTKFIKDELVISDAQIEELTKEVEARAAQAASSDEDLKIVHDELEIKIGEIKKLKAKKCPECPDCPEIIEDKVEDVIDDVKETIEEVVEKAKDFVEDTVQDAKDLIKKVIPRKKRKYTRKKK